MHIELGKKYLSTTYKLFSLHAACIRTFIKDETKYKHYMCGAMYGIVRATMAVADRYTSVKRNVHLSVAAEILPQIAKHSSHKYILYGVLYVCLQAKPQLYIVGHSITTLLIPFMPILIKYDLCT